MENRIKVGGGMIQAISDWAKNLIFLVVFAAFLELLLPSSQMQKFLRVIVGLLVMMAVLNPIVNLFEEIEAGEDIPVFKQNNPPIEYEIKQDEHMYIKIYEKELARQIKSTIKSLEGVANVDVIVHADENIKQGKVASVEIMIQEQGKGLNIKPIHIRMRDGNEKVKVDEKLEKKVLSTVAELYQIPSDIIKIQVM